MPNTNQDVIDYVNQVLRPFADKYAAMYYEALEVVDRFTNVDASIPADSDPIADGAASDGRIEVTNNNARSLVSGIQSDIIAVLQANTDAKLNFVNKFAVNPRIRDFS